jgi:predicted DNA-binding antitoxin AbrB/MazE fold protein
MVTTILAVYENGVLRPVRPLPLAEGETVQLTVTSPPESAVAETERRLRTAKSLTELFEVADAAPEPADGYDLLRALDDNRKGERLLFPPELKGVTW